MRVRVGEVFGNSDSADEYVWTVSLCAQLNLNPYPAPTPSTLNSARTDLEKKWLARKPLFERLNTSDRLVDTGLADSAVLDHRRDDVDGSAGDIGSYVRALLLAKVIMSTPATMA